MSNETYDSSKDTHAHIERVQSLIQSAISNLARRSQGRWTMSDAPTFEERLAALEGNIQTLFRSVETQTRTIDHLNELIVIMSQTDKDLLACIHALAEK